VIVRKLLAAMHGSIEVTSRKDAGTAIDIIIPGESIETVNKSGAGTDAAVLFGSPASL
jgi:hypothetical protein